MAEPKESPEKAPHPVETRSTPCFEGVGDDVLGELVGAALDHGEGVFGAGHHQVEIAAFALVVGREEHELAIDAADPDSGQRGLVGDAWGRHEGHGGAGDGEHDAFSLRVFSFHFSVQYFDQGALSIHPEVCAGL